MSTEAGSDAMGELTFEQAIERLEKIVSSLETGELGLDASIKAYEEGLVVARTCLERLDSAELRVKELALEGDDANDA